MCYLFRLTGHVFLPNNAYNTHQLETPSYIEKIANIASINLVKILSVKNIIAKSIIPMIILIDLSIVPIFLLILCGGCEIRTHGTR